jgi:hypothetical protein
MKDFSGFPNESENSFLHDHYYNIQLYSQNNSLKNNSLEFLDITTSIQNNAATSSNLNSPFQVIPQKSNIRLSCNNPECLMNFSEKKASIAVNSAIDTKAIVVVKEIVLLILMKLF